MTIEKEEFDLQETETKEEIGLKLAEIEEKSHINQTEVEKMVMAGLHLGHKTSKKHPKMEPYIYGVRNGVNIIDIKKTEEKLEEALKFLEGLISKGGVLLVIGTKIQLVDLVKLFAEECRLPYVTQRWLGGTFTNFESIKSRVNYLQDLEKKKEEGELEKYTKKEQLDISREIDSLKIKFEGLKLLAKLPDAILVLDIDKDILAIKEALAKNIKIVGIADTSVDPGLVDYPIPANDDAISSVRYILNRIKERIIKARISSSEGIRS